MQFFGQENTAPVTKASTTSITMAATYLGQPTVVLVGGQAYTPASAITLNTGTTGFNGIDTSTFTAATIYNIFAVVSSGTLGLVISAGTSPTGFTSYKFLGKLIAATGATISHVMNVGEPFVEYSSNSSTADTNDTSAFAYGFEGSTVVGPLTANRLKRSRFLVAIAATDRLVHEFKSTVGGIWVVLTGEDGNFSGISPLKIENSVRYGFSLQTTTGASTDVETFFGRYSYPLTTFGATGQAWSIGQGFWRITKISGAVLAP